MQNENADANDTEQQIAPSDSLGQAVSRGLRLCCPLCGRGELFAALFRMHERCSHCGYRFERSPGYFLGSTYINYGVTTLTATWSWILLRFVMGIDRQILIPALATFCLIFPVVFFRYARSLWLSFDTFFDRQGAMEHREHDKDFN